MIRLSRRGSTAWYDAHARALSTPGLALETRWHKDPFTDVECMDWLLVSDTRYYIITEADQWVGSMGASHVDTNNRYCDVGIFIAPDSQRLGIGSEALQQFIDLMVLRFDIAYIEAGALDWNTASVNFFLKNGFTIMGRERGKMLKQDGTRCDRIVLGRLL